MQVNKTQLTISCVIKEGDKALLESNEQHICNINESCNPEIDGAIKTTHWFTYSLRQFISRILDKHG